MAQTPSVIGTTYTRDAITFSANNLLALLAGATAPEIKADLDATSQSQPVLQQYSSAELLADLTNATLNAIAAGATLIDATIIGIITAAPRVDCNTGIAANAAYATIIANIGTTDIVNNISVPTQEAVVASMTAGHIITGVANGGASLQNNVTAGLYTGIDATRNYIKIAVGATSGTVTTNGKWQVVTWGYVNMVSGDITSFNVNAAPVTVGTAFTTGNAQVIAVSISAPKLVDAVIIFNGYILQ